MSGCVTYNTTNSGLVANPSIIKLDAQNHAWLGTSYGGLSEFNITANSWITRSQLRGIRSNGGVVVIDSTDTQWFGQWGRGISRKIGNQWSWFGNAGPDVVAIYADAPNQTLWFGSTSGATRYNGTTWTNYNTGNSGLLDAYVSTVTKDCSGNMWFGGGKGANKFNGITWTSYITSNSGLLDNSVREIVVDKTCNLWFATGKGINKFDGTTWTSYTTSNSGLVNNNTSNIAVDNQNRKWFGSDGGGASFFDGTKWLTYTMANSGLCQNSIKDIAIDRDGVVWFATYWNGLCAFTDNAWFNYNVNNGLLNNSAYSIAFDNQNNKWVTSDWGVNVLANVPFPKLQVTPTSLAFNGMLNTNNISSQVIAISHTTATSLTWTATKSITWLNLSRINGTTPATIAISPIITGLTAGMYTGIITITANSALSSPQVISVTLNIVPASFACSNVSEISQVECQALTTLYTSVLSVVKCWNGWVYFRLPMS